MKGIWRIFKYCRQRIIVLSIENRKLKLQNEYLKAILQSKNNIKH